MMMKKIIICMVLSLVSLLIAAGSFFVNDISAHHNWIETNRETLSVYFHDKNHDRDHKKRDTKKQEQDVPQSVEPRTEKKKLPDTSASGNRREKQTANPAQELPAQKAPHTDAL